MTVLAEAAALLDRFVASGWGSCHVRTASLEMFVAQRAGTSNPMVKSAAVPGVVEEPRVLLRAPHLGTVVSLAEPGTVIAAGGIYGALELLGESVELRAESAGVVRSREAEIGALIEYEGALLALG